MMKKFKLDLSSAHNRESVGSPLIDALLDEGAARPVDDSLAPPPKTARDSRPASLQNADLLSVEEKAALKLGNSSTTDDVSPSTATSSSSVQVYVRVRPFIPRELKGKDGTSPKPTLSVDSIGTANLFDPKTGKKDVFYFDDCLWSVDDSSAYDEHKRVLATQQHVYKVVGRPLLDNVMNGYNACLLAYGQTSSGKTYTMTGNTAVEKEKGITSRLCEELFHRIEKVVEESPTTSCRVEVTFVEIYNEKVKDLLAPASVEKELRVRQHPVLGPFVEGLTHNIVYNSDTMLQLMRKGEKERAVAATLMNDRSSRSHAIFSFVLSQKSLVPGGGPEVYTSKVSKVSLVDLAGSERVTQTGVTGQHLVELTRINLSLSTLSRVIDALVDASRRGPKKALKPPYREAMLTWLLSDSLGGNSKTVMIAAVSPHLGAYAETLSTLRYASRARCIQNKAVVNEDPSSKIIRELQTEVSALRDELESKTALLSSRDKTSSDLESLKKKLMFSEKLIDDLQQRKQQEELSWVLRAKEQELILTTEKEARRNMQQEFEDLQQQLEGATFLQAEKDAEISTLHGQLLEREREIKAREEKLTMMTGALHLQMDKLKHQSSVAEESLKSEIEAKEDEIRQRENQLSGLTSERKELQAKSDAAQKRLLEEIVAHERETAERKALEQKRADAEEMLRTEISEREEAIKAKEAALAELKHQHAMLEGQRSAREMEMEKELQTKESILESLATEKDSLLADKNAAEMRLNIEMQNWQAKFAEIEKQKQRIEEMYARSKGQLQAQINNTQKRIQEVELEEGEVNATSTTPSSLSKLLASYNNNRHSLPAHNDIKALQLQLPHFCVPSTEFTHSSVTSPRRGAQEDKVQQGRPGDSPQPQPLDSARSNKTIPTSSDSCCSSGTLSPFPSPRINDPEHEKLVQQFKDVQSQSKVEEQRAKDLEEALLLERKRAAKMLDDEQQHKHETVLKVEGLEKLLHALVVEYNRRLGDTMKQTKEWRDIKKKLKETKKDIANSHSLHKLLSKDGDSAGSALEAAQMYSQLADCRLQCSVLENNVSGLTSALTQNFFEISKWQRKEQQRKEEMADYKGRYQRAMQLIRRLYDDKDKSEDDKHQQLAQLTAENEALKKQIEQHGKSTVKQAGLLSRKK